MLLPLATIRQMASSRIKMLQIQGFETTGLQEKLESLPNSYDALISFGKSLNHLEKRADFPYNEPLKLDEIQKSRPPSGNLPKVGYWTDREIKNKVYGGVYGRVAGCILGKPLEISWTLPQIRTYLEAVDAWPLSDYVPSISPAPGARLRRDCVDSMKEYVSCAQEDDDLNYLILGLKVLEMYGPDFKPQDMAYLWRENIPYGWNWGPEHSRYYLWAGLWMDHGCKLPEGDEFLEYSSFLNDGEELIGAMIRGDAFGLINPGKPEKAAEMAWRDGILTHTKTGLYAEMWVAATLAASFFTNNPVHAIQMGIEQIPSKSRYAECLNEALQISMNEPDWLKAWEQIDKKWGHLGHAGTMNESAAIINALVHSLDKCNVVDYEKVICTTVMQGWDTDCSAATAGCIAGVLTGIHNIPDKWLKPLNDTMYSAVATERETKISAFAERLWQVCKNFRFCK